MGRLAFIAWLADVLCSVRNAEKQTMEFNSGAWAILQRLKKASATNTPARAMDFCHALKSEFQDASPACARGNLTIGQVMNVSAPRIWVAPIIERGMMGFAHYDFRSILSISPDVSHGRAIECQQSRGSAGRCWTSAIEAKP
jgi:hypothetical protein